MHLKVLGVVLMGLLGLVFFIVLNIDPMVSIIQGLFMLILFFNYKKNISVEIFGDKFSLIRKNFIFGGKKSFYLTSIISINYFTTQKNNPYVTIVTYKTGSIQSEEFRIYNNFEALRPFFKQLFEDFNIVIKQDGKIIIP